MNNNTTIKWVGIIAAILVTIGGWFFAGIQLSTTTRLAVVEADARDTKMLVTTIQMNQTVVMEQLRWIREDIKFLQAKIEDKDVQD